MAQCVGVCQKAKSERARDLFGHAPFWVGDCVAGLLLFERGEILDEVYEVVLREDIAEADGH